MNTTQIDPTELAKKMKDMEERASDLLSKARTKLIMGKTPELVFFSTLVMSMKMKVAWWMPTAAVDGKHLFYNPSFILQTFKENPGAVLGLLVHEAMHVALKHVGKVTRLGSIEERERANIATDCAINPIVLENKLELPSDGCMPEKFKMPRNLSAEEYYILLRDNNQGGGGGNKQSQSQGGGQSGQGQGGGSQGQGASGGKAQKGELPDGVIVIVGPGDPQVSDPGKSGAVMPAGDGSEQAAKEADTDSEILINQANTLARQRGNLPGNLSRIVDDAQKAKTNWRELLRQFLTAKAKDDYCWRRPNRRFVHRGVYLPSLHSEHLGEILIVVDTSGSISPREISVFMGEVAAILECQPVKMVVAYHHAHAYKLDRWEPKDGEYKPEGLVSGGTSHQWLTPDWLAENEVDPVCIVCLTDLETAFPEHEPGPPVFWAIINEREMSPPWGLGIKVEIEKA
jgi:predicted metal-dependent peptidase